MTDVEPPEAGDTRRFLLELLTSVLGGALLLAHGVLNGMELLELPEWSVLAYVFLIVGPYVGRVERIAAAIEQVMHRVERVVLAWRARRVASPWDGTERRRRRADDDSAARDGPEDRRPGGERRR